jgi:hypothetical protein
MCSAGCDLIQDLYLFYHFSKVINIKIHRNVMMSDDSYNVKQWSSILRSPMKRVLVRILEPKTKQKQDRGNHIMKSSIMFTLYEILVLLGD